MAPNRDILPEGKDYHDQWVRVGCVACGGPALTHRVTPRQYQVCHECNGAIVEQVKQLRRAQLAQLWLENPPPWVPIE